MTVLFDSLVSSSPVPEGAVRDVAGSWAWGARRWESANTDRLNSTHWRNANDQSINNDLSLKLKTLRQRSAYEAANNPLIAGMISTHITDIVGPNGPKLQVITPDDDSQNAKDYASQVEMTVSEWWQMPDINGQMSMADILRQDVNMLWLNGEFLSQMVTVRNPSEGSRDVRMRLNTIHPRRLDTPPGNIAENDVVLGIKRSRTGRAITYYIDDEIDGVVATTMQKYTPRAARNIIHGYEISEPGQARGIPWLATILQVAADLRDFDQEVLDTARQSNKWCITLQAESPDITPLNIDGTVDIERWVIEAMPPGWKAVSHQPPQPTTTYVDYRNERMRDLGRPICMPLMMIRLDSSDHNYSSARFDGQIYQRGNGCQQAWISRVKLNRLVDAVVREASLGNGPIKAQKPKGRIIYDWSWPKPPHVDPKKEAEADKIRLESNPPSTTLVRVLANQGIDPDEFFGELKRVREKLQEAGYNPESPSESGTLERYIAGLVERTVSSMAADPDDDDTPTRSNNGHKRRELAHV